MEEMLALGESCPWSLSTSQTLGLVMMSPLRIKISEHALPDTVVRQQLSPTSCFLCLTGLTQPSAC